MRRGAFENRLNVCAALGRTLPSMGFKNWTNASISQHVCETCAGHGVEPGTTKAAAWACQSDVLRGLMDKVQHARFDVNSTKLVFDQEKVVVMREVRKFRCEEHRGTEPEKPCKDCDVALKTIEMNIGFAIHINAQAAKEGALVWRVAGNPSHLHVENVLFVEGREAHKYAMYVVPKPLAVALTRWSAAQHELARLEKGISDMRIAENLATSRCMFWSSRPACSAGIHCPGQMGHGFQVGEQVFMSCPTPSDHAPQPAEQTVVGASAEPDVNIFCATCMQNLAWQSPAFLACINRVTAGRAERVLPPYQSLVELGKDAAEADAKGKPALAVAYREAVEQIRRGHGFHYHAAAFLHV